MIFMLVLIAITSAPANAQGLGSGQAEEGETSFEQEFVAGLRERRLYDLAESYCNAQLKENLNPTERNEIILELIRTQIAVASHASADKQEALWNRADQTAASYAAGEKGRPRSIMLNVQHAMLPLIRAQLLRREIEYRGSQQAAVQQFGLAQLRLSRERLRKSLSDVSNLKSERVRSRPRNEHFLTMDQLIALEKNVQFQMTTCDLNRGLFYPESDRDNRRATLIGALDGLQKISSQLTADDSLWFSVKIREIQANRLLKKFAVCGQIIGKLNRQTWNEYQQQQLLNEVLQVDLAMGNLDRAAETIRERNLEQPHAFQPLDITIVRAALKRASTATEDKQKKDWQDFAIGYADQVKQYHGRYWGRLADLLMVDVAKTRALPSNVQILVRLGEEYLRKKQIEKAIETFDSAFEIATEEDDDNLAFSLGYRSAVLLQQTKKHDDAADRFRLLANRFTKHRSAPSTHLLACWNKARASASDAAKRNEYEQLLKENINQWPDSESANRAKSWLGKLYRHRRDYRAAFETFITISPTSEFFHGIVSELGDAAVASCQNEKDAKKIATIQGGLESLLTKLRENSESKPMAAVELEIRLAQIQLLHSNQPAEASNRLEKLMQIEELKDDTRAAIQLWSVVALSRQPSKTEQATELLDSLSFRPQDESRWQDGLATVDPEFQNDAVSKVKIKIADKLLASGLDSKQKTEWLFYRAKAYLGAGQFSAATATLKQLSKENPREMRFQIELGRVIGKSPRDKKDKMSMEEGLQIWRRIALRVKPQSDLWFESKYYVVKLLFELGKSDDANKLVDYMKATTANWEQNPWRIRFENLVQQVAKSDQRIP